MPKEKINRKARTKLTNKVDLLIPVNIEKLGSEDDPCFGKHFDPKEKDCQTCGDSELCQIKINQLLHTVRGKLEKEGKFKDLEEETIYNTPASTSDIKKEIRKVIKTAGKISIQMLHHKVFKNLKATASQDKIEKVFNKYKLTTDKFTTSKTHAKWSR